MRSAYAYALVRHRLAPVRSLLRRDRLCFAYHSFTKSLVLEPTRLNRTPDSCCSIKTERLAIIEMERQMMQTPCKRCQETEALPDARHRDYSTRRKREPYLPEYCRAFTSDDSDKSFDSPLVRLVVFFFSFFSLLVRNTDAHTVENDKERNKRHYE